MRQEGGSRGGSDYVYCSTDSGDIVKLCVAGCHENQNNATAAGHSSKQAATNVQPPSSIVACAIRRVPKKNDVMNAGKFSGGKLIEQIYDGHYFCAHVFVSKANVHLFSKSLPNSSITTITSCHEYSRALSRLLSVPGVLVS